MKWNNYEEEVFKELSCYYMDDKILFNHKIKGRYSDRSRQIDIYLEENINGKKVITVVDCKFYNKKVNIKSVEEFISMADDVGADVALMITEKGYSKSALKRAFNNPKDIELDILNFAELKHSQGGTGFPYVGNNAVLIKAPFGWVIDNTPIIQGVICFLYNRGEDLNSVFKTEEFAYISFFSNSKNNYSAKELSDVHKNNLAQKFQLSSSSYLPTYNKLSQDSGIRITKKENAPLIEIAGYVRFDNFIFYCVCNCREVLVKRNTTKMRLLLKYVLPMDVEYSKETL